MIEHKSSNIDEEKIKILYIAGTARSGSTFLGDILSSKKDFINVGELRYIWDRGIIDNWQCTCHNNFKDCSFWKRITSSLSLKHDDLTKIFSEISERGMVNNNKFRIRNLIFNSARKIKNKISDNKEYSIILNDLYSDIKKNSENAYVLDSSKDAIFAEFLSQIKNVEICIIHIVRDPRSVIFSQVFRRKIQVIDQKRSFLMGTSFSKSITAWYYQNYLIEKLHANKDKYFRIKYEDIVAEGGQNKMNDVINKVKEWGFVSTENAKQDHSFSGNPVRFSENKKVILDKKKENIKGSVFMRIMIKLTTIPGRIRYGY